MSRIAGAVALCALTAHASATIRVSSAVESTADGIRAQAVITDPTGLGGTTAVAIKEIRSAIFIIDSAVPSFGERGDAAEGGSALFVSKRLLTPAQAYGLGQPFGYPVPPTTDPTGPWFGLMWPYRDQYDYFPDPFDPLGDDVGTPFTIAPNVYGFVDVDGIARGGPTDPIPAGGDPNLLLRGITGNGLSGPASYFAFDLVPNFGDPNRFVTIQIISTTATVVVQDGAGQYGEIVIPVDNFETTVQLPEPAGATLLAGAMLILARRRGPARADAAAPR